MNEQRIGNIESIRFRRKGQLIYTYTLPVWSFLGLGLGEGSDAEGIFAGFALGAIIIVPFVALLTLPAWMKYKYKFSKWDLNIYEVEGMAD